MLVDFDLIPILEKELKRGGFRDAGPISGSQGRLYARKRRRIASVRSPRIPASAVNDITRHGGNNPGLWEILLDEVLKKLMDDLIRIAEEGNTPCDLVFQGGGSIPLPDWFQREVEALGFRVVFLIAEGERGRDHGSQASISLGQYLTELMEEM